MSIYSDLCSVNDALELLMASEEFNEEAVSVLLESSFGILSDGLERICKARSNLVGDIVMVKGEIQRLTGRVKTLQKSLESLDRYGLLLLEKSGESKVTAGSFVVSTRKSSCVEVSETFSDSEFIRVEEVKKVDKVGIKEAIKGGRIVEGASLVESVHFSVR